MSSRDLKILQRDRDDLVTVTWVLDRDIHSEMKKCKAATDIRLQDLCAVLLRIAFNHPPEDKRQNFRMAAVREYLKERAQKRVRPSVGSLPTVKGTPEIDPEPPEMSDP